MSSLFDRLQDWRGHIGVVAMAGATILIGTLIVPDRATYAGYLVDDHSYAAAAALLARNHDPDDRRWLLNRYHLERQLGDLAAATATVERLAELHPEDDAIRLELMQHYEGYLETGRYVTLLSKTAVGHQPIQYIEKLLGLLRYSEDYRGEYTLLAQLIAAGRVTVEQAQRHSRLQDILQAQTDGDVNDLSDQQLQLERLN